MTATTYNDTKFKELLLYVAEQSVSDPTFGKTKLNKILYYADFLTFGQFGEPITGATYQRRPKGPVPREITKARDDLIREGHATVEVRLFHGYPQQRLVAVRGANASVFSQLERQMVDDVMSWLDGVNGSQVSELSHKDLGWELAEDLEVIPYETVFLSHVEKLTAEDIASAQRLEQELSTIA